MSTSKNGNAGKNNAAKVIAAHLALMEDYGRKAKDGSTAKQFAVELFQQDCLDGLATVDDVPRYAAAYNKGASLAPASLRSFTSQLAAFGAPSVIKAWPTFSDALNKMHDSKDADVKKAVSRSVTNKDKFSQLYKIATTIKDKGAPAKITNDWIRETIAVKSSTPEDPAAAAREAIAESVKTLLGDKPSAAMLKARNEFFKAFKISTVEEAKDKAA